MSAGSVAAFLAAASIALPGLAQNTVTPTHTATQTTITDKVTTDTDAHGKTVVRHHRVVKHHKRTVRKSDDMANKSAE